MSQTGEKKVWHSSTLFFSPIQNKKKKKEKWIFLLIFFIVILQLPKTARGFETAQQ